VRGKAPVRALLRLCPHAYISTAFGQQYSQPIEHSSFHFTQLAIHAGMLSKQSIPAQCCGHCSWLMLHNLGPKSGPVVINTPILKITSIVIVSIAMRNRESTLCRDKHQKNLQKLSNFSYRQRELFLILRKQYPDKIEQPSSEQNATGL